MENAAQGKGEYAELDALVLRRSPPIVNAQRIRGVVAAASAAAATCFEAIRADARRAKRM